MSAVVTGASGFVGRALCARLRERGDVTGIMRHRADGPWNQTHIVDLSREAPTPEALRGMDTVFHLAARTHAVDEFGDHEDAYRAVNVDGTRRLLETSARAGVRRFVFFSSVKAMGEGGPTTIDETLEPAPTTAYGRTKLAAEELVLRGGFVPMAAVLRLTPVYGPAAKGNLPRMVAAIRDGRFPPVPHTNNRRSMVHVDDVTAAAVTLLDKPEAWGRAYIVAERRAYSVRDIYEAVLSALGRTPPGFSVPRAAFVVLARFGDLLGRVRGRRWAFDSEAFDKLFNSAQYDPGALCDALSWEPSWDLPRAMPDIIEALAA